MCNRYHFSRRAESALVDKLHVFPVMHPDTDIWPTKPAPVAIQRHDVRQQIESMPWGILLEKPTKSETLLFARMETVFSKPMWGGAVRQRRCLVMASAFWETQCFEVPDEPMIIAGIHSSWQVQNRRYEGFVMLSAPSTEAVMPYNDRMPLILPESAWEPWFDPQTPLEDVQQLLQPWRGPLVAMEHPPAVTPRKAKPAPPPPPEEQMEMEW